MARRVGSGRSRTSGAARSTCSGSSTKSSTRRSARRCSRSRTRSCGTARIGRTTAPWPASATRTNVSTVSRSATSTSPIARSPSSMPRWTWASASCGFPPGRPAGDLRVIPTHDAFWSRLAERGVPFVLHVGSGRLPIGGDWMNDGRPAAEQFSGAEIIGSKDFMVVYQTAARFLSVLVLDGVLERHPLICTVERSRWARVGCPTCCADSITPPRSGADQSPGSRRSRALRPSRRARSSASPRIRSRTSVASPPSPTRACTCSRRTIRTPKGDAIRSVASSGHGRPRPPPTTR